MSWLPMNFGGSRSFAEALEDAMLIARAPGGLNQTHLQFGPPAFTLEEGSFLTSELNTLDGAAYYTLEIRLRDRSILLRNAYNGL